MKNRPFTAKKTYPYQMGQPPDRPPRSLLRSLAKWGFTLFFGAWMFVLGIIVGRMTTPAGLDADALTKELKRLKAAEMAKDREQVKQVTETLKEKDLPFFEVLPRSGAGRNRGLLSSRPSQPTEVKRALTRKPSSDVIRAEPVVETPAEIRSPAVPPDADPREDTGADSPFAIQVASLIESRDADRLVSELREKGYAGAYRADEEVPGIGLRYRVKIGYFSNRSQARAVLKRLKKKEGLKDAYIFKRK